MPKITSLLIGIIITTFLLFSITFQVAGAGVDQPLSKISVAKRAKQDDSIEPQKIEFSISQKNYLITKNGLGVMTDSSGKITNFKLPIDTDCYVVRVYYVEIKEDLVILYGVSCYDDEQGAVIRVDQIQMKQKWVSNIPGFNIGEAVFKNNYLYLSAIGFIGKLDLASGAYVWQHKGLYNKKPGLFNSFERPIIKGEIIEFKEKLPSHNKGNPASILVDDKTGQIISPR